MNSPKDYLTDRVDELNDFYIFEHIGEMRVIENWSVKKKGTDSLVSMSIPFKEWLDKRDKKLITQSMEVGREEIVDIVKKQRNIIKDGMTMDERKSGYYLSGASRLEKRILTELKTLSKTQ